MRVDVHCIHLPKTDGVLWEECRDSITDEPVNLHLVKGVEGHIGKGRVKGFDMGDSPYVSCIDPDDVVLPGAFQACIEALDDHPEACGVYTDELLIDSQGKVIRPGIWSSVDWNPLLQLEPKYLHHIYVMRRSYVRKYFLEMLKWHNMSEYILKCLVTAHGPWIHVDRYGYKWRIAKKTAHSSMSLRYVYAARWRVIPALQQAAKKYDACLRPNLS
jgi:hypothetical protein